MFKMSSTWIRWCIIWKIDIYSSVNISNRKWQFKHFEDFKSMFWHCKWYYLIGETEWNVCFANVNIQKSPVLHIKKIPYPTFLHISYTITY